MRLIAPLLIARTLATDRVIRRGTLVGALAFAQRILTPAMAWVLFGQPFQAKLAVGFTLAAVFGARTYLQRAFSQRTEAELMARLISSVLDGDVLRPSILPEEDAQADLGHGVYFGAQQLTEVLPSLAADLVAAAVLAGVVVWVEPVRLVLGATALTLVAAGLLRWSRDRIQRAVRVAWERRERVIDKLVDALEGRLEIVGAGERTHFGRESHERARAWSLAGVRAASSTVMSGRLPLLAIASSVALLPLVDSRWRGTISVNLADAALFAAVTPAFAGIAQGIIAVAQMERSVCAVARVMLDARPRQRGKPAPKLPMPILFEDVAFRYDGADEDAVSGLSFTLRGEGVFALTGANGSGKSTCLRLMLGVARPRQGSVQVGGVEIANLDHEAWGAQVAFLPQRPYLPRRSDVRTSIHLLAPAASDERMQRALERVGLWDALARASRDPLETNVDSLSVGQRQRVGLARLLCRDASLFLLDEPDANLDRAGIALVADIVRELSQKAMVALAAHTPDLLLVAERILVLSEGRVVRDETRNARA